MEPVTLDDLELSQTDLNPSAHLNPNDPLNQTYNQDETNDYSDDEFEGDDGSVDARTDNTGNPDGLDDENASDGYDEQPEQLHNTVCSTVKLIKVFVSLSFSPLFLILLLFSSLPLLLHHL